MTTLAQARKNYTNNGISDAIRAAIKRADRPLSKYKLHLDSGFEPEQVGRAVRDMLTRGALFKVNGANGVTFYDVPGRAKPKLGPKPKGNVAGPITIPQFNWLGTRLG